MAKRSLAIGGLKKDKPRLIDQVLNRTLALGAAVAASYGAPRQELLAWLREVNLESDLTAAERALLTSAEPGLRQITSMSWQAERLKVLLWALCKVSTLPSFEEQCSIAALECLVPPYGDQSLSEFRASCNLRSHEELFHAAFAIQELHAVARKRERNTRYKPEAPPVDQEVVSEAHHAINWLVGYQGQSWDEVTTDT